MLPQDGWVPALACGEIMPGNHPGTLEAAPGQELCEDVGGQASLWGQHDDQVESRALLSGNVGAGQKAGAATHRLSILDASSMEHRPGNVGTCGHMWTEVTHEAWYHDRCAPTFIRACSGL
jgi:hypothetical protein